MHSHRSLMPEDVLKYGPSKMALMVASEFWRAKEGSEYRSDVIACYDRARELMGVLETCDMGEDAGIYLKPYYEECRERELFLEDRLRTEEIEKFSTRLAEAFEEASVRIAKGQHHA